MYNDSGCLQQHDDGAVCGEEVPKGAPVDLCRIHLISAYRFMQEELTTTERPTTFRGMRPIVDGSRRLSVVYYLRFRDRVKIGTTSDLRHRLIAIPHDEIMALEPGDMSLERSRHQQFAAHRVHGEWFRLADPLVEHMRQLKREHRTLIHQAIAA